MYSFILFMESPTSVVGKKLDSDIIITIAQSAGAIEYTDCFSAEG